MSRRGILLLVLAGLFVLFCAGWALTTQALAGEAGLISEPQITQANISAFDPVPPPASPPPRK